jgi:hypothetical protein
MIKLTNLLVEVYGKNIDPNQKWWAILVDSIDDWEIIAHSYLAKDTHLNQDTHSLKMIYQHLILLKMKNILIHMNMMLSRMIWDIKQI